MSPIQQDLGTDTAAKPARVEAQKSIQSESRIPGANVSSGRSKAIDETAFGAGRRHQLREALQRTRAALESSASQRKSASSSEAPSAAATNNQPALHQSQENTLHSGDVHRIREEVQPCSREQAEDVSTRNTAFLRHIDRTGAELLGYDLTVRPPPCRLRVALRNVGNTCYLNAVLHAITPLRLLRAWLHEHIRICPNAARGTSSCPTCTLASDVMQIAASTEQCVMTPRTVATRGEWSRHAFANFDQHDAQEAFSLLFQACDAIDLNRLARMSLPEVQINGTHNATTHTTPYSQIFGAILRATTECNSCQHVARSLDPLP